MDPVRDALTLVAADVDRSRLGAPADIRARGDRIRRRRRAVAAEVGALAMAVAVVAVLVGHGIPHAAPRPLQTPRPTPNPAQVQVVRGACGHGVGCATGTGPFRVVLDAGHGGDQLSLDLPLPPGWSLWEMSDSGVRAGAPDGTAGVSAMWPVRRAPGAADARAMAESLARLPGATVAAQPVDVGGKPGWRVVFARVPSGSTHCADPRFGLYEDERTNPFGPVGGLGCASLFQLGLPTASASTVTRIGLSGWGQVEITLVDVRDVPTRGARSVLSLWRWGPVLSPDGPGPALLAGVRIGAYADPYCGADVGVCSVPNGSYVAPGDPVVTSTGIHSWDSQVGLRVPAGWGVGGDDGRGDVHLVDPASYAGAVIVWEPQLPGQPPTVLHDARAWAVATAGRPGVASRTPVRVQVAGRTAWRVDVSANRSAVPFRQSDPPYVDSGCSGDPLYFAVALACWPAAAATHGGEYVEINESARLWFVQVDPNRVLLVEVWANRLHRAQPSGLPAALAATTSMIGSLSIR